LNLLGTCRVALDKFAAAEAPLRDGLKICQEQLPNAQFRYDTESLLGASLAGQKKFAEAEPLLVHAVEGFQALKATTSPLAAAARAGPRPLPDRGPGPGPAPRHPRPSTKAIPGADSGGVPCHATVSG